MSVQRSLFQSTLPCGERLSRSSQTSAAMRFNPRSRAGSDFDSACYCARYVMFQSTLPCGERPRCLIIPSSGARVSIHAPVRGATHGRACHRECGFCFNPRSRAGSDCALVLPLQHQVLQGAFEHFVAFCPPVSFWEQRLRIFPNKQCCYGLRASPGSGMCAWGARAAASAPCMS